MSAGNVGSGASCLFCGWRSPDSSTRAMESHYIAAHMQGVEPPKVCPYCSHRFYTALALVEHQQECRQNPNAPQNAPQRHPGSVTLRQHTNKETPNITTRKVTE